MDEISTQYAENIRKRWNVFINKAYEISKILNLNRESTILEIGSGSGTYTLPFAKIVKHVTVVEPSKGMTNELIKNMRNWSISNVTITNKRWEDVIPNVDVYEHDYVFASHSLVMVDIDKAIEKMNKLARKGVCIITRVGESP